MMSFSSPSSWLAQARHSRPVLKRRRPFVSLRLEKLETRITPSVTVVPQQFTTNQYTALSISQSQLLAGDSGSAALTASNPTQPTNATLVDNQNGTFTFTPNPGFTGSTTFQYSVGIPQDELPASANFGATISISGDTAIIGAPGQGSSSAPQGEAYVFVRSGNTWTQQAILTAADGGGGDQFGNAVAVDGDTAVIGAPGSLSTQGGAAYVFVRSGSTWTQQAKLTSDNGNPFNIFDQSIAISGDTVVISATQPATGFGDAYVFVRSGSTWSKQAVLSTGGNFGVGVSISGDTVVLGQAAQEAAYVYVRSGSTWTQQALLTASDGTANDNFGGPVSVSGDTVVVGAPSHTVNGSLDQGAAYVFVRSGSTWTQQAELTANDGSSESFFGFAVEVSGDTAIVQASFGPISPSSNAVSYVFVRSGSTWNQQAELSPANGNDSSLALSGDTVILGSPTQGTASVFVQSDSAWTQQAELIPQDFAEATATVQVNPAAAQLMVSPATLPTVTEGQVCPSTTFTATGGAGSGYTFQESGLLPTGLTFDATTGQLTGTPTQVGDFPGIVIAASDGHGGSGSQTYTLIVNHDGVNGFPVPYPLTIYAPPTSKTDPNADLDAYISGLYNSILDRNPEAGTTSLPFWENVFNLVQTSAQTNPLNLSVPAGTTAYQYVADGIWQSQEHRWEEVETYYQDFLGRPLDLTNAYNLSERQYWTNQFLFAGATEEDVIRGFLTSPEYLYDHRADASLANALNTNLPSGAATTADLQTWTSDLSALDAQRASIQNQTFATPEDYVAQLSTANLNALDNETAKTGVLFDMLSSNEYQQAALNSFYQAFLRRAGTQAEEQALLGLKDSKGNLLSLGAIAEMILASPEYRSNAVNSEV
jgi:FG-GAP repeat/Cadherin-like domain/Putative Ig domain